MSIRREQYRALLYTRKLLTDSLTKNTRPKSVKELKQRASQCLRHFPPLRDNGEPLFSDDKIGLK